MRRVVILTFALIILVIVVCYSFSAAAQIPCYDDAPPAEVVLFKNSSQKWFCGIEWWEVDQFSADTVCAYLRQLEQIEDVNLRVSRVIADIYFDGQEDKTFHESLRVSRTRSGVDVFHYNGNFFMNDAFVDYIIEKLEIENFDAEECDH